MTQGDFDANEPFTLHPRRSGADADLPGAGRHHRDYRVDADLDRSVSGQRQLSHIGDRLRYLGLRHSRCLVQHRRRPGNRRRRWGDQHSLFGWHGTSHPRGCRFPRWPVGRGSRALADGVGNFVPYDFYTDAGRTQVLAINGTITLPLSSGVAQTVNLYGQARGKVGLPAGSTPTQCPSSCRSEPCAAGWRAA